MGIIEIISKIDIDLKYKNIDFKEYAEIVRNERLRRILGKSRNEFLSKNLMIPRINLDIWKMITYNKKRSSEDIKNMVLHYLNLREQEIEHYKDNRQLKKEVKEMKEKINLSIDSLRAFVSERISDLNYIKEISTERT